MNIFIKLIKELMMKKLIIIKQNLFSRILQDYENQLLMNMYDYFTLKKIKMMSLIFDGILLLPKQSLNIKDIENYLYNKSNIPMKISVKPFECHYKKFGESNINIKDLRYKNKCYINQKVIHHNHSKKFNNIIDYICNNCNLKIKNNEELVILFHNSKGYDNSYMIDIFSKIENIQINCLAQNQERFKILSFKIPDKKYKIKIIDSLSFLQSNLDSLSKELDDDFKSVTKNHFQDKFVLVNKKLENFPYMYVNAYNLNEKNLPEKKYFNNILTMKDISDKEYNNVQSFYKK